MIRPFLVFFLAFANGAVMAQTATPYAGYETRTVKALSEAQISDLRAGRGMGLALVAELNGYPGPTHVLELSRQLGLSATQHSNMKRFLDAMKMETIPLGERLIEQEAALEGLFAERSVTEASLRAGVQAIAATQSELRIAHLKYHLSTIGHLTPMQMDRYAELRGYANLPSENGHKPTHH